MAKVYLESTDTSFIVNNSNTVVYGANGAQTITVASGVTNVIADQNVEKVVFSGATNDYTYAQIGNQMGVYKDGTLVTTIPLQGDSDGTQFQFSNGTTNAMLTSGVMTIGGGSVSSTPTSVTMTDTAITKTTTTTTTPTTPADTGGGGGGDTTAPTLSSSTPTDNATAVAIGANIVLTLNETVTAVTGKNIYIKTTTGDTTVATIDAASSQVTISGGVVTINPTADLSASTEYYVLVESGAFKDAANNVYTGISSTTALSFTTATPTPAITYSGTTFAEAAANDGSITANVTLTLANDTFTGINGNALTGAVVTNVPTGLTAVVTKTSDTVATVTFTGAATNHANANDIANLTITLGNTAFTGGSAAAVTNATKSDLVIDFADAPTPAITYSGTTFAEAAA
ncbi:MAG TPA: Ig-like domain-containing protein, partial [Campylobacterales bacterium]|nr:Ig-like domain-containing protein [Campylobacterales bacterium]